MQTHEAGRITGMAPRAVIIGSGIGGSGIGALLAARLGFEVHLYEKSRLIGGRYASYERDGFRLDIGCHAIANSEKGTIGRILDLVGESVQWTYTRSPVYFIGHRRYRFPRDASEMGLEAKDVDKLFALFSDVATMSEETLRELDSVHLQEFLNRYTTDKKVQTIFAFIAGMYFCIPLEETPVGEWARCQKEIIQNLRSGYPIGGTGAIPAAYCRAIERAGGSVYTNTAIRRILVQDSRALGVERADGTQVRADLVISNADIKTTTFDLVGPEHYPATFVERIRGLSWSYCTFTMKVALNRKITEDRFVIFIRDFDILDEAHRILDGYLPETIPTLMVPVVSNMDPTAVPEGKQIIYAGTGCWPDLDKMRRTRSQWEHSCMNGLKRIYPDIEKEILWVEDTGPEYIHALCGEEGNVIGISQRLDQVGAQRPPFRDPYIANLFHCSADTGLHGIGGELAADAALRLYEHLSDQYRLT